MIHRPRWCAAIAGIAVIADIARDRKGRRVYRESCGLARIYNFKNGPTELF